MKILIYGAGVVGCTYGWQLSEAGCDVTVLVKSEKRQNMVDNGIRIHCSDFRVRGQKARGVIFRPKVVDRLCADNDFEYIFISTNNLHLDEVLPVLKASAGKAHILFFQNMWVTDFDRIAQFLLPEQYFFGFPFMAGGGMDESGICCAISGLKYSNTPIGELNGSLTARVQKIVEALDKANLKPQVMPQIKTWLVTHYVVAAALSGGIVKAGSGKQFVSDTKILKEALKASAEGLAVCSAIGINPKSEKSNKLYYLPLFVSAFIAKKVYSNEALCLMFDGHTKHSPSEIRKMIHDIIDAGEKQNVEMPCLRQFATKLC